MRASVVVVASLIAGGGWSCRPPATDGRVVRHASKEPASPAAATVASAAPLVTAPTSPTTRAALFAVDASDKRPCVSSDALYAREAGRVVRIANGAVKEVATPPATFATATEWHGRDGWIVWSDEADWKLRTWSITTQSAGPELVAGGATSLNPSVRGERVIGEQYVPKCTASAPACAGSTSIVIASLTTGSMTYVDRGPYEFFRLTTDAGKRIVTATRAAGAADAIAIIDPATSKKKPTILVTAPAGTELFEWPIALRADADDVFFATRHEVWALTVAGKAPKPRRVFTTPDDIEQAFSTGHSLLAATKRPWRRSIVDIRLDTGATRAFELPDETYGPEGVLAAHDVGGIAWCSTAGVFTEAIFR